MIYVQLNLGAKKRGLNFKVVEELGFEIIIETNIIYGWEIILDFQVDKMQFQNTTENIDMFYWESINEQNTIQKIWIKKEKFIPACNICRIEVQMLFKAIEIICEIFILLQIFAGTQMYLRREIHDHRTRAIIELINYNQNSIWLLAEFWSE
jgi:hypothetical protein